MIRLNILPHRRDFLRARLLRWVPEDTRQRCQNRRGTHETRGDDRWDWPAEPDGLHSERWWLPPSRWIPATSQDGALVYAVDSDNQAVLVAKASDGSLVTRIGVGAHPSRIVVGQDDKIYVSNRGERTVSVISKSNFQEITRIPVGVEPMGLSISEDGRELYVVSSTDLNDPTHGTLTSVDTTTLKPTWSVPVGEEPRGVAVGNGKAYVSNLKSGQLTVVDVKAHTVTTHVDLNNTDDPDPVANPASSSVGLVADVTASPDGSRVYAPHVWQRNGAINLPVGTPGGYYQTGGPCGIGAIVTPGLATVQTSDDSNLVDSFASCTIGGYTPPVANFPPSVLFPDRSSGTPSHVFQGPAVAVVDPTGDWIFVANRESNNIVLLPTGSRLGTQATDTNVAGEIELTDGEQHLGVPSSLSGVAPDGLALSKDGQTLYAYSQLGHDLSIIRQTAGSSDPFSFSVTHSQLASDTLTDPSVVAGRALFNSATDQRISSVNTGIACASCHVDGREDGHTWVFPDGPRRTPELAGRDLGATAPYHWTGVMASLSDFYNETIQKRMGGSGLADSDSQSLTGFVESLPAPENPLQNRPDLASTLAVGQAAFHQASCDSCHTGPALTNNSIQNVGTIRGKDLLEDTENQTSSVPLTTGFNVPSLLGIGRSAPYLHDGSVLTISQRLAEARTPNAANGLRHGDTSTLTNDQMDALATYLSSL